MIGEVVHIGPNGMYRGERHAGALIESKEFGDEFKLEDFDAAITGAQNGNKENNDGINVKEETDDEGQRPASHIMTVKFQSTDGGKIVDFATRGQFKKLCHAYASTCHKLQGGEAPTVVILCHSANIRMLCREWLYTAVTRAQERVIFLANTRGMLQALRIQRIRGRTVEEKARQFLELQDKNDHSVPKLPKATKLAN